MCLDVVEVKVDEIEMQSTTDHKELTNHESEPQLKF